MYHHILFNNLLNKFISVSRVEEIKFLDFIYGKNYLNSQDKKLEK